MFTIGQRLAYGSALLLLSLAASPWPGGARADLTSCASGSVCYYVAIQPIDVCSSTGSGCAPFNTSSKIGNPGAATSTTPIGFVDSTSGKDITRAIWNQIGVDIAWAPIQQYNNTSFQTIPLDTTTSSQTFLTLSDQNNIANGVLPIPSPLSASSTVINMFFVNSITPPPGQSGILYGFSWINNNGIAISANTFFPPFPLTPRFDTLAHEIGHNLSLNHADSFNYGYDGTPSPAPASDLMTQGSTRTEPSSTTNALSLLASGEGKGTADQLECFPVTLTGGTVVNCTLNTTPTNVNPVAQRSEVALSGFLNPIASSTTTASTPGTGGTITTALVVSDTAGDMTITAAPGATKPNTSINFDVTGPTNGRLGETLIGLVLSLGKGLHFDPTNPANFFGNSFVRGFAYDHGSTGDANCPIPATQCLLIQLSGLPEGSDLFFTQGIVGAPGLVGSSGQTVTLTDLMNAGVNITYKFSDGLIITSTLTPFGCCELVANSQQPSTTVPSQIDPSIFTSVPNALPCVPTADDTPFCSPPTVTGGSDGDPSTEGGQLTPPNPG